ncbi:hypothetical protein KEM48_008793 [Puccinia striiformis f. sp. tritici PST-130]|nr:hypothetical protein KEM48_008793 [Puccinia striiformis f. sp. tritici PST-130]
MVVAWHQDEQAALPEDVARYRANNNEMERRSLTRLPANQYTFGTLDTIEEALQTLDPEGKQRSERSLTGWTALSLSFMKTPTARVSPRGALGDNA